MILHNEELHCLCRSPSIVRIVKSRGLQWTGHVARIERHNGCIQNFYGEISWKTWMPEKMVG
jgi:hypothetical protein